MPRQRLTTETLDSIQRRAAAREHIRLAEAVLGPAASDTEILAAAQRFSIIPPHQARQINKQRQVISAQTRRLGAFDGAEDPWDESGPDQPDPTNNQAYTKQIITSPGHSVQDSLQKKDIHAPTATRRNMSQVARRKRAGADEHDEELEENAKKRKESPSETEMEELGNLGRPGVGREAALDEDIDEDILPRDDMEEGDIEDDDLEDNDMEDDDIEDDDLEDGDMEEGDIEDDDMEDINNSDDDNLFDDVHSDGGDTDFGLDDNEDALDDLLGMEEGDENIGGPGEGVDLEDDDEDLGALHPPKPLQSNHRHQAKRRSGRQAKTGSNRRQETPGRRQASVGRSGGESRVSLDEILNLHDEDIERQASTPLDNDDLQALLGKPVDRAGNRISTPGYGGGRRSAAVENRRAMLECVWDNQNEPDSVVGPTARRRQASVQGRKSRQRKNPPSFAPDRRRVNVSRTNEWDQVFGAPDVSKFFE
jgi:hypothetical protein